MWMAINGNKWQGPPAPPPDTAQCPVPPWGRHNPSNKFYIFEQILLLWTNSTYLNKFYIFEQGQMVLPTSSTLEPATLPGKRRQERQETMDLVLLSICVKPEINWDFLRSIDTYWYLNKITCGQFRLLETNCFSSGQNAAHHHLIF